MNGADEAAGLFAMRMVMGLVFLRAGTRKLGARETFASAVANYDLLPANLSAQVARWLPPIEVGLGFALVLGLAVVPAAAGVVLLLSVFTGAVSVNLLRGRTIECGCLGPDAPAPITWWTVGRNLVLGGAGFIVAVSYEPTPIVTGPLGTTDELPASDAAALLIAVLTIAIGERLGRDAIRLRAGVRWASDRTRGGG